MDNRDETHQTVETSRVAVHDIHPNDKSHVETKQQQDYDHNTIGGSQLKIIENSSIGSLVSLNVCVFSMKVLPI